MIQSPVASAAESGEFLLQRYTLPNGLRVWLQPRADSESVAALLVLGAGSRYERLANNGVSHFVEHMLFVGTERWSEDEIKDIITRRGGRWNGWTGEETTTYFVQISAQDLNIALDWLAQVVFHPTFPADKIGKERQVIFQERLGRYGWLINTLDSWGLGYELDRNVRRALFPHSTLGLRIVGEDASLEQLDRAGLMNYYRTHYTPENATLIVVGKLAPEATLEQVETSFGGVDKPGRPALPDTPSLPTAGPQQVVVRGPVPTDQMRLMVGARTVGRAHPDRWALEMLAEVLENVLTKEIRYRRGLVYGLGVYNDLFDDTGYFVIYTMSESRNRETILAEIEKQLEQTRRGETDAAQVAEAQVALKGRWALAMEDNVARAQWLAQWSSFLGADQAVPDYAVAIDAVTPAELARVVKTYFIPERRYMGLHQPVATVASGARALAAAIGLALTLWGGRRVWRQVQARRKHQAFS